jgi:Secretion system C-terminal sorting domain
MKKYFLLFVVNYSFLLAQDFPRGVFLDSISVSGDTATIYNDLRSTLNLNTLRPTVKDNSDIIFTKGFNLLVREQNLWGYSTGQQLILEAQAVNNGLWVNNYFASRVGTLDGTLWKIQKLNDPMGLMVYNAVPDSEYNFLQYGRKYYTARFIMKADTAGIPGSTLIADVIVYSKTRNSPKISQHLFASNFSGKNTIDTFFVHFDVDSVTPPPPSSPSWSTLTAGNPTWSAAPKVQEKIDLQVYWYKAADTWLDKVIVEDDDIGQKLFAGTLDDAIRNTAALYNPSHIKNFYLLDEPPLSTFRGYYHVDKTLQNASYPAGITSTFYADYKLDRFIGDAAPNDILLDYYVINSYTPHPTMTRNEAASRGIVPYTSWDYRYDLRTWLDVLDSALNSAATKAASNSKKFMYVAQSGGIFEISSTHYSTRPITASELNTTVGMALAFGAKGIFAWPYQYFISADNSFIYPGLVDASYDHSSNYFNYNGAPIYGGFNDAWTGYSQAMTKVKNLGPTLLTLTWQGTHKWYSLYTGYRQTYGNWPNPGIVTRAIPTRLNGVADTVWQYYVETGYLKDASFNYILNINTRCDTGDTRNITLYLQDTTTQWRLTEVSTTDTTVTSDTGSFTKQYSPGDWKLFKILQKGPSVPKNVAVTAVGGHPRISWSRDIPGTGQLPISGYEIYRSSSQSGPTLIATTSGNDSLYLDNGIATGSASLIYYNVKAKDNSGLRSAYSAQVSIHEKYWIEKQKASPVAADPTEFALRPNYPNPFNPATTIAYDLAQDAFVTIKIYNELGQEIRTLVNEEQPVGRYSVQWNAANLPSGIYFCRIKAGSFTDSQKMIFTK